MSSPSESLLEAQADLGRPLTTAPGNAPEPGLGVQIQLSKGLLPVSGRLFGENMDFQGELKRDSSCSVGAGGSGAAASPGVTRDC